MEVTSDDKETSLSSTRLYEKGVPPNGSLNTNRSLYLTISYLLRDIHEGFGF